MKRIVVDRLSYCGYDSMYMYVWVRTKGGGDVTATGCVTKIDDEEGRRITGGWCVLGVCLHTWASYLSVVGVL